VETPGNVRYRHVFCVLSARALPYAEHGLQSLFAHAAEALNLTLITDEESDKQNIERALATLDIPAKHRWSVHTQAEADRRATILLSNYPRLRRFRYGHPCWRKLTDPLLFSALGEEMIILDSDLYFPNLFSFEKTPDRGVLLMWQPPSCLLPDDVVRRVFAANVKLAHHVDIGVAQLRNDLDLEWFDWFVGILGGSDVPKLMHVEAIAWAAIAMRTGGGYFDALHWYCWRYSQWKRVALKLGVPGVRLLEMQSFRSVKCFHATGVAKWWISAACERKIFPRPRYVSESCAPRPFEELSVREYESDQRVKRIARRLGYYDLMTPRD